MNFDQPNNEVIKTPEVKIKKGVNFVFEQNPKLAKIGTELQYSKYLETVFPASKIKDIKKFSEFTHFGTKEAAEHRVKTKSEWNIENFKNKFGNKVTNLLKNNSLFVRLIKNKEYHYPVVINLKNIKEKKDEYSYFTKQLIEDKEAGYDGYKYENELEDKGSTSYVVFEPEQIHILGLNQDVEKFKEFVSSND